MSSPISTPLKILNKKFNIISTNTNRELNLDFSTHTRLPRRGDKVLYTASNGSLGIGYFVGIKKKQETCIVYKVDVRNYPSPYNVLPHFSYLYHGYLRLVNWSEVGLDQVTLDAFSTFLTELQGQ